MALKQKMYGTAKKPKFNAVNKLAQAKVQKKKPAWKPVNGIGVKPITNTAPSNPGSTSQAAAASTPAAPSTPNTTNTAPQTQADAFNVSSYNPASGQPDPRDAEYWANLAKLQATSQQDFAAQQLEQSQSDIDYNARLSEAGEQRRRGVRNTAESLIGTGLLRSGHHNRRQTEDTIDYTTQLGNWGREKSSADAKRKAYMDSIMSNLGLEEQSLYAEAAGRYAEHQADAAANSAGYDPTTDPSSPYYTVYELDQNSGIVYAKPKKKGKK